MTKRTKQHRYDDAAESNVMNLERSPEKQRKYKHYRLIDIKSAIGIRQHDHRYNDRIKLAIFGVKS